MKRLILLASLLALSACDQAPSNEASPGKPSAAAAAAAGRAPAPAAGAISIDVPGFKAKVDIPNLSVSGGEGDAIDGVPLYPQTRISGASVSAGGGAGAGEATVRYSAPAAPDTVLAYYRDHALRAGYRLGRQTPDSLSAAKPDGSGFTIVVHPGAEGGTEGSLTASGK